MKYHDTVLTLCLGLGFHDIMVTDSGVDKARVRFIHILFFKITFIRLLNKIGKVSNL